MKQVTFAGGSIITGSDIADALLRLVGDLPLTGSSVSVDIPVLESNGKTTTHTLLLAPGVVLDVADVDGIDDEEERERFPVPALPPRGMVAQPEDRTEALRKSRALDDAIAHTDEGLGR